MNNIFKKAGTFFCSLLLLSSCSESYLDTMPTDSYSEDFIFENSENAMIALNGIHRSMYKQYDSQDQAGYSSLMLGMEVMGEDFVMTSSGNGWWNSQAQWINHLDPQRAWNTYVYSFLYATIRNANAIINRIDPLSGEEKFKNQIKGEALTYRALAHLWLVQLYAKPYASDTYDRLAIPLMLEVTDEPQPMATTKAVYDQIKSDFMQAEELLIKGEPGKYNKSHFSVQAVQGWLARYYLTIKDWQNASVYAQKAITTAKAAGAKFMSQEDYKKGFNSATNPEWLWASIMIPDQTVYFYSFFAFASYNFSSSNIRSNPKAINDKLYAKIPATDVRKWCWVPDPANLVLPSSSFKKYPYMNRKFAVADLSSSVGDIPYMRLAELYLIDAEAKARMNDNSAADVLFELVKTRDASATKSTATGQALIDEVMTQRRIELWGEGFRFLDLKRLGLPLDRNNSNNQAALVVTMEVPASSNKWLWQFPQDEINANPNVVQNPI